ncbi:hypothetical protein BDW22DRAFT_1307847, partial [Trametopsis cervina]
GKDMVIPILGEGTVVFDTKIKNQKHRTTLSHVLYIPDAAMRIISPQQFTSKGYQTVISTNQLKVVNGVT